MKHSWMVIALPLALAGCGDADETQKDPVDVTPPAQSSSPAGEPAPNTAPAERDPTPQTGTGGDSPSTAPSGTNSPPSGQP